MKSVSGSRLRRTAAHRRALGPRVRAVVDPPLCPAPGDATVWPRPSRDSGLGGRRATRRAAPAAPPRPGVGAEDSIVLHEPDVLALPRVCYAHTVHDEDAGDAVRRVRRPRDAEETLME
ncbi:hypothetical protein GCM10020218_048550 [Dactylosporangium vinaceum]